MHLCTFPQPSRDSCQWFTTDQKTGVRFPTKAGFVLSATICRLVLELTHPPSHPVETEGSFREGKADIAPSDTSPGLFTDRVQWQTWLVTSIVHNVSTVPYTQVFSSHSLKYHFNALVTTHCQLLLIMILATNAHISVNSKQRKDNHRHMIYLITELALSTSFHP
jgi:hypothetical protein